MKTVIPETVRYNCDRCRVEMKGYVEDTGTWVLCDGRQGAVKNAIHLCGACGTEVVEEIERTAEARGCSCPRVVAQHGPGCRYGWVLGGHGTELVHRVLVAGCDCAFCRNAYGMGRPEHPMADTSGTDAKTGGAGE